MSSALALDIAPEKPAKPFLKWAGGKTQLLPEILARFPRHFGRYHEPFIGGGAVFFALKPKRATLTDINEQLIGTYIAIRDDPNSLIRHLQHHRATSEHFYDVRAKDPTQMPAISAAARMIFMNRTCFNGLYRVNRKGKFNVPFGKYKNPTICNGDNLYRASEALRGVDIRMRSAFESIKYARKGDLVYFDPPYDPVSATASFTSYTNVPFGKEEQKQLATVFRRLANRGVHVVLSNSDTPFIRQLYRGFQIDRVTARRAINSCSSKRGPVHEVIVHNPSI